MYLGPKKDLQGWVLRKCLSFLGRLPRPHRPREPKIREILEQVGVVWHCQDHWCRCKDVKHCQINVKLSKSILHHAVVNKGSNSFKFTGTVWLQNDLLTQTSTVYLCSFGCILSFFKQERHVQLEFQQILPETELHIKPISVFYESTNFLGFDGFDVPRENDGDSDKRTCCCIRLVLLVFCSRWQGAQSPILRASWKEMQRT